MKKAQIINKILNKILKEYNVIVQYFFYFGNKKREALEPLFFSIAISLFSRYICCSRGFFGSQFFIFAAHIAFCHFDSIFIVGGC